MMDQHEFHVAMLAAIEEHGMGKRRTLLRDGRLCTLGAAAVALGMDPCDDELAWNGLVRDELDRRLRPLAAEILAQYPERARRWSGSPLWPRGLITAFNDSSLTRVPGDVVALLEKIIAREEETA